MTWTYVCFKLHICIGWVSSIKDQGQCGSCVAFATGGILEGCLAKAGVPIADADISEQQFLDCANMWSYGDQCRSGCDGQYGDQYLEFVKGEHKSYSIIHNLLALMMNYALF